MARVADPLSAEIVLDDRTKLKAMQVVVADHTGSVATPGDLRLSTEDYVLSTEDVRMSSTQEP